MAKEIRNLKPWSFVKTQVHDISGLKDNNPEFYMYQYTSGVYYPAIKKSDIPKEFAIKFAD